MTTEKEILNKQWKTPKNPKIFSTEEVFSFIQETLIEEADSTVEVSVGTDSQHVGKLFRFVTVLCAYKKGKGGVFFYSPETVNVKTYPTTNQKMRMFDEATKSIEMAQLLTNSIGHKPQVHIDASPEKNGEFTSAFVEQIKGYVVGCGFDCITKPDSYTASFIADKYSKKKSKNKRKAFSSRQ